MKVFKLVTIPERQEPQVDRIVCDLCGTDYEERIGYAFDEITIERSIGTRYPEGGSRKDTAFDVCGLALQQSSFLGWRAKARSLE